MIFILCISAILSEYNTCILHSKQQTKIDFRKNSGGAYEELLEAHLQIILEAHFLELLEAHNNGQKMRLHYLPEAHIEVRLG